MKLKRLSEDFRVQELSEATPAHGGEFALYKLTKRGLGTHEAVAAIVRRWKLTAQQVSFGGLKDRHAVTTQFVTIRRGPRRHLRQTNLELKYVGQAARPFGAADISGNRFEIVLRAMAADSLAAAAESLDAIRRDGLPNYFDDQRFGSFGESNEFVARAWIAGDYERAIWLALADPNPLDRLRDRAEKQLLRQHWGDWQTCAAQLRSTDRRSVANHLRDRPGDFRGAIARIRPEQRSLYINAFQSYLWNRLLDAFLRQTCAATELLPVSLRMGVVPFFTAVDDVVRERLMRASLPLPSARLHLDAGPTKELVDRSLAELGLALRALRIKYPRDSFFSKGDRAVTFTASNLSYAVAADELYRGAYRLTLRFDLPRGSYATIVIKRIAASTGAPQVVDMEPPFATAGRSVGPAPTADQR